MRLCGSYYGYQSVNPRDVSTRHPTIVDPVAKALAPVVMAGPRCQGRGWVDCLGTGNQVLGETLASSAL